MTDLSGVRLEFVDNTEKAGQLMSWLGERRPEETLGVDLETGEKPGNPKEDAFSPWHGDIRLAQIGDGMTGWAIPWERWGGVFEEAFNKFEGNFLIHNSAFDTRWLTVKSNLTIPWHRLHDSMIASRIVSPTESAALKRLTSKYVDKRAAALQVLLDDKMRDNGWTWGTVPITLKEYWSYGALDTVLSVRIWEKLGPEVTNGGDFAEVYDLEMGVRRISTQMELNGSRINVEYSEKMYEVLMEHVESIKDWAKKSYGINLNSTKQLVDFFQKHGVEITEFTPGGSPKADKVQLQKIQRDYAGEASAVLAEQVLISRKYEKLSSSYFKNFINMNVDGLLHPSIDTLAARTGRMCIPDSHMLVTENGPITVDNICVGDRTLDHNGEWTTVTDIHRYDDAEVVEWDSRLSSTRNHRWVWQYEGRNKEHISSCEAGRRQELRLAPNGFDPVLDFSNNTLTVETEQEKFAAVLGMLVSDGSCTDYGSGVGLKARIYQTENKFYSELVAAIPQEAVMYDVAKPLPNGNVSHTIGIKTRWLRDGLIRSNLDLGVGESLKTSANLVSWVLRAPLNEVSAFLKAAFLCDGSTSIPNQKIMSCQTSVLRKVYMLAGYRLGYVSSEFVQAPSEWSDGVRYGVRFKKAKKSLRSVAETVRISDVWCVTTESGTFTAWSQGPYLTGNSIKEPALQTLPKSDKLVRRAFIPRNEDEIIMSCDLEQVEARVFASLSKDTGLIDLFNRCDTSGGDFFTEIGRETYREPGMVKSDPRRQLLKNMMYGRLYGAGITKMALTAGVKEAQMKDVNDSFDAQFPGMKNMMRQIEDLGMRRLRNEGEAYIMTATGRRLPADEKKVYTLVNYLIQGTSAEILKINLLKMDAAGLTDMMVVPVHDEIVLSVLEKDMHEIAPIVQECMTTRDGWTVPLLAGVCDIGERWGDMSPIA